MQTGRFKHGGLFLANTIEMRLVLRLISLCSTEQRSRFYPKNYPLWGGLTNMNLNNLPGRGAMAPTDYLRAVSTGPVAPLVLSVTTFGGAMNVTMSCRRSVFTGADAAAIRDRLVAGVEALDAD